jgi:NAD(P)-dependent dehydrogenase (short-subunit alcohol dehydrogenase family)
LLPSRRTLVEAARQSFGAADILVNNAVVRHFAPLETAGQDITCNAICPGTVPTPWRRREWRPSSLCSAGRAAAISPAPRSRSMATGARADRFMVTIPKPAS